MGMSGPEVAMSRPEVYRNEQEVDNCPGSGLGTDMVTETVYCSVH